MPEIIIQTRITPKKPPENIISREKLLSKMQENSSKNMILVMGPGGYGKTTLVQDFLSSAKLKFAWFHAAEDIDTFYSFINYFTGSLNTLQNSFGGKTLELADSLNQNGLFTKEPKTSVNSVIGTFINEFVSVFKEDVYLVIDDLQNLGEHEWVNIAFNSIIENFPENFHLIITSRYVPDFNISRLSAKRNLLKIETADLNFSTEETAKLLKQVYSIQCKESDIKTLDNKMEGWITGLHLILQAYGKDFLRIASSDKLADDNIYNYFADDIFNVLDDNHKDFLLQTSLLDSFTTNECSDIFGINDSKEILEELCDRNFFIESTVVVDENNKQSITYSYHNLFRDFLIAKLKSEKNKDEIEKLYSDIFEYYKKNNNYISAIEFSLLAKKYVDAIELINNSFEELFYNARYELLFKWIDQIPEDLYNENLQFRYNKALILKYFKSDNEGSYKIFSELLQNPALTDKDDLYFLINIESADYLITTGKLQNAIELLKLLYNCNTTPGLHGKVILSLARAYYRMGSITYDDIIKLLNEGIIFCDLHSLIEVRSEIYKIFGNIYQNRGEFIMSLHYFENIAKQETNIFKKFLTLTDIILLHAWSGQYSKAMENLEQAKIIYGNYPSPLFKRNLIRITGHLKFECGDYEDSIHQLEELIKFDNHHKFNAFSVWNHLFIAECNIFLSKQNKALEQLHLAASEIDKEDKYQSMEYELHEVILQKQFNEKSKVTSRAEKILLTTLKYFESNNLVYSKVQIEFHLADYYFKKGNLDTSLKYLKDSLNTSSENQYISYLAQNFFQMRYLFDLAMSNKIQKDFINSIRDSLIERTQYEWLSNECRNRMSKDIIKLYDIYLNTFGGAEIYVCGNLVTEDKWLRKKSKLMLIYLMVNKGLRFTKDKMLELFFGELSADSAENIFHQAITNIRNAIKPEGAADTKDTAEKTKSAKTKENKNSTQQSFIVYEDKILRLADGFHYKIDAIDFDNLAKQVKSSEIDEDKKEKLAKEAVELYKGDFLAGNYDEWVEELRVIYQNKFTDTVETLLSILKKKKKYEDVIIFADKLIHIDKLHEEAFIDIIEAYNITGNTTMAKKKFTQLLKNYEEEYGEKPKKSVLNRIEEILTEK